MGKIFVVATPIGNLRDITLRAAEILLNSKIIVAESASKAGLLLNFIEKEFNRKRAGDQKIILLMEDEEEQMIGQIIRRIEQSDASLISEAGTPLISDPGFKLVREAIKRGIRIIPVPGPTASISALIVSGLPSNSFWFIGYLPKKDALREKILRELISTLANIHTKSIKPALIIYESPHRLLQTLRDIQKVFGNINIVVARELTKIHEEVIRDNIMRIIRKFEVERARGEFVILI